MSYGLGDELHDLAHRQQVDRNYLTQRMTEVMIRTLYFQEGEPNWASLSYEQAAALVGPFPDAALAKYRNDAKFHTQVQRAVAWIMAEIK